MGAKQLAGIIAILLMVGLGGREALAAVPDGATPVEEPDISGGERAFNFAFVYVGQWMFYAIEQRPAIAEYGSFDNWVSNPRKTVFDNDGFDYNVMKHTLAGNLYYLFYRSRGYTEKQAFIWSFASSLAFEYTIETLTEPPSLQDIYQTPVFGTLFGMGAERASRYLRSLDTWPATTLGYILNPFALFTRDAAADGPAPLIRPLKEPGGWEVSFSLRY